MIQNLSLGPPIPGLPNLKMDNAKVDPNSKDARSDSFGKSLEEKMKSKDYEKPKDAKLPGSLKDEKTSERTEKAPMRSDKDSNKEKLESRTEKAEIPKGEKEVKTSDREKAIKKFMDSFESEFGIPTTRLVEAIANLDEAEQLKSPEETVDAVVEQLNLSEQDQDRARAMYSAFLITLAKVDAPVVDNKAMLLQSGKDFGDQFKQRVQLATDKKSMMNMGVDRLNQKFWMKDQPQSAAMAGMSPTDEAQLFAKSLVDDGDWSQQSDLLNSNADLLQPEQQASFESLPPHLKGQLNESATPAMMAALAAKMAQAQAAAKSPESTADAEEASSEGEPTTQELAKLLEGIKKPDTLATGAAAVAGAKLADQENASSQGQSQQGLNDFAKNMSEQKELNKDLAKNASKSEKLDFKQSLQKGLEALNPLAATKLNNDLAAPAAAGAALATQAAPTSAENETNIRQLMNQAQYLIKKGGGEVKVQMTPEGLGPVHLKIMLQDGKVDVQMSASSEEAKKTIESSLAELKTSLAAHKLSVDHVKVDVVNTASADTATNNQSNLDSNAQRDSARQFWNQFNDNFGSRSQRESLYDVTGVKAYNQPNKTEALKPIETSNVKSKGVNGKGQGLNLVA